MAENLLRNGGFEADWSSEKSHRCLVVSAAAAPFEKNVGNIFTPSGWMTWFRHDPGTWDQPEVRDSWKSGDPRRVHGGEKGMLLFTFFRKHDGGFYQQVSVTPGARLRLTAWAHAWSNHPVEGQEACLDDGRCSCGVGREDAFIPEGEAPEPSGDPWLDAIGNFTFRLGIDPTGGKDPLANTVVWGPGAHIYNTYAQVPQVEAVAQRDRVTVFLRSTTLWPFKHNDAYWDDVELVVVGQEVVQPPETRLSHRPASPQVGEIVTIEARSMAGLTHVHVTVNQPSGAGLAVGQAAIGHDGDWNTWTYRTLPTQEAGRHTVDFGADGGVAVADVFDCRPEARLSHRPDSPQVGEIVTVEARSLVGLTHVYLVVRQPSGAGLAVGQAAIGRDGDWTTWTYRTLPTQEAGTHSFEFGADGGVKSTASFECVLAPTPPRGSPREQYERTYVLLPPDAGEAWALAAIDAVWDQRRYTVGSSADDAGIGDLDARRVIAVNPGRWPSDLRAFFAQHYPGVEYAAVEAATPADLKQKLKAF